MFKSFSDVLTCRWVPHWKPSSCCATTLHALTRWSASASISWASEIAISPTSWLTSSLAAWWALTLDTPSGRPPRYGIYFYTPAQWSWRGGILDSPCPSVCPSVCRRHGFRSISQVCFGISISNFICMLMVAIGRSLLIFSDVTFKMAALRPYWIFSCDQAALWMVQFVCLSVCPSVRPSVRLSVTPFWLCSHHPIIMKFSGVITSDKSDVRAKGQRSRSQRSQPNLTVSGL